MRDTQEMDYSKWDKFEISDDETIDVHPNVDKASFVRWKQQAIHKKRQEVRNLIFGLEKEIALNEHVIALLEARDVDGISPDILKQLEEKQTTMRRDIMKFQLDNHNQEWGDPIPSTLITQAIDYTQPLPSTQIIQQRQSLIKSELEKQLKIQANTFTADLKTVYDKTSFPISKDVSITKDTPNTQPSNKQQSTDEQQNKQQNTDEQRKTNTQQNTDEDFKMTDILKQFAKTEFMQSKDFIQKHPQIINTHSADTLLAEALQQQVSGNPVYAKQLVFASQLLSYIITLSLNGKVDGVSLFYNRIAAQHATSGFISDVDSMYTRVSERAKVLQQEEKKREAEAISEAEEMVQLATRPDGTLAWPLDPSKEPTETQLEKKKVFDSLPHDLKMGLLIQDVDLINSALKALEDAETVVAECGRVGLISLVDEEI
jgi:cell division cycle protein 37